jgi:putative phage-type endonuclease
MKPNLHFEQRSEGWLNQRKGHVTASAIGAIMGYNPYSSREDEMLRMLGIGKKFEGNAATEWGTFNEAGAVFEFEMETGLKVKPAYFVEFEEWMGASPDGYVSDGCLIEIKCPYGKRKGGEFKSIMEQMHYYAQIQMQLFCTKKEKCYFYQWGPHSTMLEIVFSDNNFIKDMLVEARVFYDEYKGILKK